MWFRRKHEQGSVDTLATLSQQLKDIQADFKRIEGEWDDAYERIMRGVGRLAKRDQRSAAAEPPAPGTEGPVNGDQGARDLPQQVLARRTAKFFPGRH